MSLGRKPSPGGETNVCRMLERIVARPPDLGCWIRPTPSLLAEPSRPRDIIFGGGRGGWCGGGGRRARRRFGRLERGLGCRSLAIVIELQPSRLFLCH